MTITLVGRDAARDARRGPDLGATAALRAGAILAGGDAEQRALAADALRAASSVAEGTSRVQEEARAALTALGASPVTTPAATGLSARERELLGVLGRGLTDKEIAADLVILLAAVSSHLDRIRDGTGRHRRPELTRLADELGLTPSPPAERHR